MTTTNPYYTEAVHGQFQLAQLGELELESGRTLHGVELAYQTLGELSPAKDNAVLIPSWFSGTHGIMRDVYVGAGRAIDPAKHFVILVNQLGSGLGSSPHNTAGEFPHVTIGDDVTAQERLLREVLGIEKLALVFGGSMGAMQAYEWAVRFPERVERLAVLAGTARALPRQVNWTRVMDDSLASDPEIESGSLARLYALQLVGREVWTDEHWRDLGFGSGDEFVSGLLDASLSPMDGRNLAAQAWKWRHADASRNAAGDLASALGRITSKTVAMAISSDMMFPPTEVALHAALVPDSRTVVIDDVFGHAGLFGLAPSYAGQIDAALESVLSAGA
ncbi:alpha/beta fold hydrolase [Gryllotalpicola protaetiae]|uniref:Alpha/beta fold hydrolase n=1 Tax=Gryllotalpicola protaetiae TaxID=2419771 RepID=A0A387BSA9_9MICO|nr:alpha/beta fold hydrolase [Gryllotalpicola protaetiae]AYG03949.1 alpha/beta fold hydrolase [Gryllotalpicola protaetiae]